MDIVSYKDLIVWQKSMDLVVLVYKATDSFPKSELYGLVSQMRRAAVSVPSNISEGKMRGTRKDFCHFLVNAFGSGAELETQLEISKRLNFINTDDLEKICNLLSEVMRMLNSLIGKLNQPSLPNP